jgi:phosphatidate cytidylyltransferase
VPFPARADPGSLRLRVVSALVLAPPALAAVWFGGIWLGLLTLAAAGLMAWEWSRLCNEGRLGTEGGVVIASVLLAVLAAAAGRFGAALAVAVVGAVAAFLLCRRLSRPSPRLLAVGTLYVGLPCIALLWLAASPSDGRATLLWVLALVWATDTGAYAFGRTFGGPKLAPRVSPKKTWSGLLGGVLCAALAGLAAAFVAGAPAPFVVLLVSAGLAVVEQFGDLAESAVKRRFGAKDAGTLIPGHGGLLDRLDGLLAVAPAVALLSLVGGGGVLTWR